MSQCSPGCSCRNTRKPSQAYYVGQYVEFTDDYYDCFRDSHKAKRERGFTNIPTRGQKYYVLSESSTALTVALPCGEKHSAGKDWFKWF